MNFKQIFVAVGTVVISVVLSVLVVGGNDNQPQVKDLGGLTRYSSINVIPKTANDGFSVGTSSSASLFEFIVAGTCNPLIPNHSITASSTLFADCAITGVQTGDLVLWSSSATSTTAEAANAQRNVAITGASASTTNGYVSFQFMNFTGQDRTLTPGVASSVPYYLFRKNSN